MTNWLTIRQAAQKANVSTSTIRRRIEEGKLRIARTAGDSGHYRVDANSLDDLFANAEKKAVAVLRSFGL
jgi:excisionase family DNA binding protein